MLKLTAMLALGACGLLTGCAPMVSLHPLVSGDEAALVDIGYVGLWKECTGNDVWKVERKGDRVYGYFQVGQDSGRGEVRLVDLEGTRFADIVPDGGVAPAHLLAKVRLEGDTLHLALLNEDAASKALPHETVDKQIVITADTPDLRRFLISVRNQPEFFDEEAALCRLK